MTDASWGNLGAKVKRNTRINTIPAIIGDETGAIYHPYLPGYVWVRQMYNSGYGKAFPVVGPAGNSIVLTPGTRVGLAQTSDNKLKVEALDVIGGSIDGTNLYQANVPQLPSGTFVAQQSFVTALVTPQQIPDLTVTIKSWIVIANATYYEFPGVQAFDVSGSVPSSGNNRFAVIFLDSDYLTPRVTASTARANTDLPLGAADIQECLTAAPSSSTPLAAVRLYGGQTQILNSDIIHDLRQMINTAATSGVSITAGAGLSATPNPIVGSGTLNATPALFKPVLYTSSTNITVSSPGSTIDGGSPSAGTRILLIGQSTGAENGIWIWNGAATPLTRPTDYASGSTVFAYQSAMVWSQGGATNSGIFFNIGTSGAITIDTTAVTWNKATISEAGFAGSNFLYGFPSTSARNRIFPQADIIAITARRFSSGSSSNIQEWQTEGGVALASISVSGALAASVATLVATDSATATITDLLIAEHNSSGTPAANFGTGVKLQGQSSTTVNRDLARWRAFWTTATDGSRKARAILSAFDTVEQDAIAIEASGSAAMIGFLGAAPSAQQASGANLTNNVTSGGTTDTIADFTSLTVYATDAAAIRNDIYQLARKLKQVNDALRLYGLLT